MTRKMLMICCLLGFSLGVIAGCTPPAGDEAPPATTESE